MSEKQREKLIKEQVTHIQLALEKHIVLRELLTIVVAIDTTGSMGSAIITIKNHMAFLQRICVMYGINLVFIDFKDMEDKMWSSNGPLVVVTQNASEIREASGGFNNGGECAGLAIALARAFNPSAIIVITDDNLHKGRLAECEKDIGLACELPPVEGPGVLVVEVGRNTNFRSVEGFKVQRISHDEIDNIISIISLVITAHEFNICADNAAELAKKFISMLETHGQYLLTSVFAQSIFLKFDKYRLKFPEVQQLVSKIGTLKQTNMFSGLDIVLNQKVVNKEMAERNVGSLMPRFVSSVTHKLTPSYVNAALASGDQAKIWTIIRLILEMTIVESKHGIPVGTFNISHALSVIVDSYKLEGRFKFIIALLIAMKEVESDEQQIIRQAAVDYLIASKSSVRIDPNDPANKSWSFLTIAYAAADYLNDEESAFVVAELVACKMKLLPRTPFVLKMLSHEPVSVRQFDETFCTKCKKHFPSAHCLRIIDDEWKQSKICTFCELTNDNDKEESSRCINKQDHHAVRCTECKIVYVTMGSPGVSKPRCFVCLTTCPQPPVYTCITCGNSSYTNECVLCLNGVTVDVITPVTVTLVDDDIAQKAENYAEFLKAFAEMIKIDQPDRTCCVCSTPKSGIKACTRFGCKTYICIGCLQWEKIIPGCTIQKATMFCCSCEAPIDEKVMNSNPAILKLLAHHGLPKLKNCMKVPANGCICKICLEIHDLQPAACGEDDDNHEYICDKCTLPTLPGDIFHCPGCNAPIESTGGCPHFHCPQCDTHFCKFCTSLGPMDGSTIYHDHIYPNHRCNRCYDWSETIIDGFCKDCSN